ncbi:MAG TPA: orotidine 5'-phosphate decarboxylase / HUMPS family protein, partial [Candidatus Eisenbacteria bacterium]|nr:orotidine 5'-phosphate decarboxylase / HUMPS family protein [Candidatus Eisenbacteria bacterium]
EARGKNGPRLLAVTVLTSLDGSEYPDVYRVGVEDRVLAFAAQAVASGVDGVVLSSRELSLLVPRVPAGFLRVIPGIRPADASLNDQARVATPRAALESGATHLVIGRPITRASDPVAAARSILKEMEGAHVTGA